MRTEDEELLVGRLVALQAAIGLLLDVIALQDGPEDRAAFLALFRTKMLASIDSGFLDPPEGIDRERMYAAARRATEEMLGAMQTSTAKN